MQLPELAAKQLLMAMIHLKLVYWCNKAKPSQVRGQLAQ